MHDSTGNVTHVTLSDAVCTFVKVLLKLSLSSEEPVQINHKFSYVVLCCCLPVYFQYFSCTGVLHYSFFRISL